MEEKSSSCPSAMLAAWERERSRASAEGASGEVLAAGEFDGGPVDGGSQMRELLMRLISFFILAAVPLNGNVQTPQRGRCECERHHSLREAELLEITYLQPNPSQRRFGVPMRAKTDAYDESQVSCGVKRFRKCVANVFAAVVEQCAAALCRLYSESLPVNFVVVALVDGNHSPRRASEMIGRFLVARGGLRRVADALGFRGQVTFPSKDPLQSSSGDLLRLLTIAMKRPEISSYHGFSVISTFASPFSKSGGDNSTTRPGIQPHQA
jgi:hypothetical protein